MNSFLSWRYEVGILHGSKVSYILIFHMILVHRCGLEMMWVDRLYTREIQVDIVPLSELLRNA